MCSLYVTYSYSIIYLVLIYSYISTVPQHLQILATPLSIYSNTHSKLGQASISLIASYNITMYTNKSHLIKNIAGYIQLFSYDQPYWLNFASYGPALSYDLKPKVLSYSKLKTNEWKGKEQLKKILTRGMELKL